MSLGIPPVLSPGFAPGFACGDMRGSPWGQTFAQALGTNDSGWTGYTFVVELGAALLTRSGSQVRVTLRGHGSSGSSFPDVFIGEKSGAGNAWDSVSVTRITFGGGNSAAPVAGGDVLSDPITFALDETKNYHLAFNVSGSGLAFAGGVTGANAYYKAAVSEAGVAVRGAGYTTLASRVYSARLIETFV